LRFHLFQLLISDFVLPGDARYPLLKLVISFFVHSHCNLICIKGICSTDLHIYILDAVPAVHVVWNHVDTDKLTTANGGTFMSSSASLSNQSR